jgi:hypothetical protein
MKSVSADAMTAAAAAAAYSEDGKASAGMQHPQLMYGPMELVLSARNTMSIGASLCRNAPGAASSAGWQWRTPAAHMRAQFVGSLTCCLCACFEKWMQLCRAVHCHLTVSEAGAAGVDERGVTAILHSPCAADEVGILMHVSTRPQHKLPTCEHSGVGAGRHHHSILGQASSQGCSPHPLLQVVAGCKATQ